MSAYDMGTDIPKDKDGGFVVSGDVAHAVVHLGYMYEVHSEDLDLDTDENNDMVIITGDKEVHTVFDLVISGGRVEAYIYEGATITEGTGTDITIYNRNRNYPARQPLFTVKQSPTVTNTGTLWIKRQLFGSAQGQSRITSEIRSSVERVLAPNTTYLIRQTAKADNCFINLDALLYERTVYDN